MGRHPLRLWDWLGLPRDPLGLSFKTLSSVGAWRFTSVRYGSVLGTISRCVESNGKAMTPPLGQGLRGFSTYDIHDRTARARVEEMILPACRALEGLLFNTNERTWGYFFLLHSAAIKWPLVRHTAPLSAEASSHRS